MSSLNQALSVALVNRRPLLAELHTQGTDCYRLFHGSQEGASGLTIDRYGPQLLVQSFHASLDREALLAVHAQINTYLGVETLLVYNDRSQGNSRVDREDTVYKAEEAALADHVGHEWGLNYRVRGRHAGQDPLLFLDLRNTRGWVKQHSAGKSVLNLFAYTCGVASALRPWRQRGVQSGLRRRQSGRGPRKRRAQPTAPDHAIHSVRLLSGDPPTGRVACYRAAQPAIAQLRETAAAPL